MTEIIAAILGAIVGAVLAPLVMPLEWLSHQLQRRYGPRPKANDLFDVHFVNEQGQNTYVKNDEPTLRGNDLSWFRVNVHFKLRVKERIVLTNIELNYPDVNAWPTEQTITVNGSQQVTDSRFGLGQPKALEAETVIDVLLFREFRCNADKTWYGDYKHVVTILEFSTRRSDGFYRLVVTGTLKPGGQVSDVTMQLVGA